MRVGFLQVGPSGHGLLRYGQVLAGGARALEGVEVLEHTMELTEDPAANGAQVDLAREALKDADVWHLQFNHDVWGGKAEQAAVMDRLLSGSPATVATWHDVFPVYGTAGLRRVARAVRAGHQAQLYRPDWIKDALPPPPMQKQQGQGKLSRVKLVKQRYFGDAYHSLKALTKHASALVVHSGHELGDMPGCVRKLKPVVIPHYVEARQGLVEREQAKQALGVSGRRVVVLQGFISERKGSPMALDALQGMPEDVVLVLAGGTGADPSVQDLLKALHERAAALGLADRFRITGYLDDPTMDLWLSAADLGLLPFLRVSASGSLATWIAAARPVLAHDLPAFRELDELSPGAMGFFSPYTPDAVAEGVTRCLADPPGEDAVRSLGAQLSLANVMQRYHEVYRAAVEGRR